MLMDLPSATAPLEALPRFCEALRAGALPVGSVEYVREAMRLSGVAEPEGLSYPKSLASFLQREVLQVPVAAVPTRCFVKPTRTKAFTGFVRDEACPPRDDHDREQAAAFARLPADELVWVSMPVHFLSEWRYYVVEGRLAGAARYDPDGDDGAPPPDARVVAEAIELMRDEAEAPVSFAIDFGVLASGVTALVEVNDGWALGLYGRALSPRDYYRLLRSRWDQLRAGLF